MTKHKIKIDIGEIDTGKEDFDNATTLKEYLATNLYKGFKPEPRYYKEGDFLTHFTKEKRCYAKTIDEFLTVYISIEDDSIVGCKIKNIKKFIENDLGE